MGRGGAVGFSAAPPPHGAPSIRTLGIVLLVLVLAALASVAGIVLLSALAPTAGDVPTAEGPVEVPELPEDLPSPTPLAQRPSARAAEASAYLPPDPIVRPRGPLRVGIAGLPLPDPALDPDLDPLVVEIRDGKTDRVIASAAVDLEGAADPAVPGRGLVEFDDIPAGRHRAVLRRVDDPLEAWRDRAPFDLDPAAPNPARAELNAVVQTVRIRLEYGDELADVARSAHRLVRDGEPDWLPGAGHGGNRLLTAPTGELLLRNLGPGRYRLVLLGLRTPDGSTSVAFETPGPMEIDVPVQPVQPPGR